MVFLIDECVYEVIKILKDTVSGNQIVFAENTDDENIYKKINILCLESKGCRLYNRDEVFNQWLLLHEDLVENKLGITARMLISYIDTDREDVEMLIFNYLQQDYAFYDLSLKSKRKKINNVIDGLAYEYENSGVKFK
jgi:hypothetical protein